MKNALENYFLKYNGKKVGVFLSSGKDSRLIIEICKDLKLDVTAFTLGHKADSKENKIAEKVCTKLKTPHDFLKMKTKIYSVDNIKNNLKIYGNDPSISPSEFHYYHRNYLSSYDVVFNGSYLTDSFRMNRLNKENLGTYRLLHDSKFDKIVKEEYRREIKEKLSKQSKGKSHNEMALQNILDGYYKILDVTKNIFNLECPIFDEEVLNTMWSIPENGTVKKILKKYYSKTINISDVRSPFPLSFPWQFSELYRKMRNTTRNFTRNDYDDTGSWSSYKKIYLDAISNIADQVLVENLDFEFIDKEVVKSKIKLARFNKSDTNTILKLVKVKIWLDYVF